MTKYDIIGEWKITALEVSAISVLLSTVGWDIISVLVTGRLPKFSLLAYFVFCGFVIAPLIVLYNGLKK